MASENTTFGIVFKQVEQILADERNTEFQVSFGEAPPAERDAIDELRRLAMQVSSGTSTVFMTS